MVWQSSEASFHKIELSSNVLTSKETNFLDKAPAILESILHNLKVVRHTHTSRQTEVDVKSILGKKQDNNKNTSLKFGPAEPYFKIFLIGLQN